MNRYRIAIAGAALALSAGAGGALHGVAHPVQAARPAQAHKTVPIKETSGKYRFSPARLTVRVGTKVTWVNKSDAPHTVTGTKGWSFSSKTFSQGQSVSYVFKKAGTFHYMCAIHPYMKATVTVKM